MPGAIAQLGSQWRSGAWEGRPLIRSGQGIEPYVTDRAVWPTRRPSHRQCGTSRARCRGPHLRDGLHRASRPRWHRASQSCSSTSAHRQGQHQVPRPRPLRPSSLRPSFHRVPSQLFRHTSRRLLQRCRTCSIGRSPASMRRPQCHSRHPRHRHLPRHRPQRSLRRWQQQQQQRT